MGRILGRIVVGLTISLISFISYSVQIFVIWPWYGSVLSFELLALLAPFNVLVGLLFWNYWLCVVTDPGGVPHEWHPDTQSLEGYEVKKLTGGPRFCRTCNQYKPPRAHHCKQCKRCVLRMDHHCPWVNNCVGYYNYGHFIRFLFFVDVACWYHLLMLTRRVFDVMGKHYVDTSGSLELVFIILNYVTCLPVLMMVGGFSLYHFYSLAGNSTTIEGWEKDRVATLIRRGKIREVKFPYNIGIRRNIESVLGRNPLMWTCPTVPPGNGLKYQLAEGDGIDSQESWPPRDPTAVRPDPNYKLELPPSPWTYENDGVNPDLQPSSARQRQWNPVSALPPYHPDYSQPDRYDSAGSEDDYGGEGEGEYVEGRLGSMVRRGSEGYEVRPVDREEVLRRYIETRGEEAGRYQRYAPEPPSESDSSSEADEEPLVRRVNKWRSGEAIA